MTKPKMTCAQSIARMQSAVNSYRSRAYEPVTLHEFIALYGEVYSAHFVREFALCKDGMVRVRRLASFGKWADSCGK